jgi:transcriptional regulator with XRE-family HTH domain
MTINREEVSRRLKAVRSLRGKSQVEFGEICGIGMRYGNIERNQEPYSEAAVLNIAEKLGIDPSWLLDGCGEDPTVNDTRHYEPRHTGTTTAPKETVYTPTPDHESYKIVPVPAPGRPSDEEDKPIVKMPGLKVCEISMKLDSGKYHCEHSTGVSLMVNIEKREDEIVMSWKGMDRYTHPDLQAVHNLDEVKAICEILMHAREKAQEAFA